VAALIVTPLRREFDGIVRVLRETGHTGAVDRVGPIDVVRFPELATTVAMSGFAKAQSAAQTQYLVDRIDPLDVVVCAGVSGALSSELKVGDVVVGIATVEHDLRRRFVPRPPPEFAADERVVAGLRRTAAIRTLPFGVHFGRIASGDEDVVEPDRARELLERTGALCVAWEGAGVARACQLSGVGFVELRGVTDGADASAPADFERHLDHATGNVAALLVAWITAHR